MNLIRRATKDDIPGIITLLGQVLYIHHIGRPDIFKEEGQKYEREELEEIIENPNTPVFVCMDQDGSVLGHCFCQITDRKESSNTFAYKTLYIDDLCVDEDARGLHIGKRLYQYVKDYAKEEDIYNITLHAWACNPNAVAFYKALGLEVQQYTMEEILK